MCAFLLASLLANPTLNAGALDHRAARPESDCWQGEVTHLDTIRLLSAGFSLGPWMAKNYLLCRVRRPGGQSPLRMKVTVSLSSEAEGPDSIADWHTRQHAIGPLTLASGMGWQVTVRAGFAQARSVALDETTRLQTQVEGEALVVRALVYGTADGQPWFVATWHARFRPIGIRRRMVWPARRTASALPSQRCLVTPRWLNPSPKSLDGDAPTATSPPEEWYANHAPTSR
jgi:hypothetical protein